MCVCVCVCVRIVHSTARLYIIPPPIPQGRVLDSWRLAHNAADAPPMSPVKSSNTLKPITLLPFGATDLRIAELPVLSED